MNDRNIDKEAAEVDLFSIVRAICHYKWLIMFITLIVTVGATWFAFNLPNVYSASVSLAPAGESDSSNLGRLTGQFSGLASLAGFNLSKGESSKISEAIHILKSWGFIEEFIIEEDIAAEVVAVKGWNEDSGELVYDLEIYDPLSSKWRHDPQGKMKEPSSWKLYEAFLKRNLIINQDKQTGFITLTINHYSPQLSTDWATKLVNKINLRIRQRDIDSAQKNIDFLNKQVEVTSLSSMQAVFYQLLEEQIKALMLAQSSNDYVFRVISPARVPEAISGPKRMMIIVVGVNLGLIIGVIVSTFLNLRRDRATQY